MARWWTGCCMRWCARSRAWTGARRTRARAGRDVAPTISACKYPSPTRRPTCRGMDIAPSCNPFLRIEVHVNRALYAAGWGYVALCGVVLLTRSGTAPVARGGESPAPPPAFGGAAGEWFAQVKPFCNAVEVEVRQQHLPAPATVEGAGYSAACYALAGKIDRARDVIDHLEPDDRSTAAGIVFSVGHPVADAGDDQSAGPIMRLVVSY